MTGAKYRIVMQMVAKTHRASAQSLPGFLEGRNRTRVVNRIALAVVPLLMIAGSGLQSQSGGSTYSVLNIGDIVAPHTAAGVGRGGVETSVTYPGLLNSRNPASWNALEHVTIHAALAFEQYKISDADESAWANRTALHNAAVGFPFWEQYNGTIGVSVRPYSVINYKNGATRDVPSGDTTAPAEVVSTGSGGVSEGVVGVGLKPVSWMALGAAYNFYFGTSEKQTLIEFESGGLNNAGYETTDSYGGSGATAGLLLYPVENTSFGATVKIPTSVSVDRRDLTVFRSASNEDTIGVVESERTVDLPLSLSFGASYRTGRTVLSAEVGTRSWESGDGLEDVRGSMRAALGLDYLADRTPSSSGLEQWAFRAGAWYDQTYYSVDGVGVDAFGIGLGTEIPFSRAGRLGSGAGANVGIELGTRGSTDDGMTRELFGKLFIELAIGEIWQGIE